MIVTVTLNPTLDRTLMIPELCLGEVNRARAVRDDLGGKGVNVSRALQALGLPSTIVALLAGWTGKAMHEGLLAAGFDVVALEVPGETRRNVTLRDEATNQTTKVNEPGPALDPAHAAALAERIAGLARPGDLWAFCGALPPAAPSDFYARLIAIVQAAGARAFLDTSGAALKHGLPAHPFGVKPNREEAAELLGVPLEAGIGDIAAARALHASGIEVVALSAGADGLVLAMGNQLILARPPRVPVASPIGAGDSALAGLLWAVSEACDPVECARRAVACGAAAAMQEGTGVGDRALVEQLLPLVEIALA